MAAFLQAKAEKIKADRVARSASDAQRKAKKHVSEALEARRFDVFVV